MWNQPKSQSLKGIIRAVNLVNSKFGLYCGFIVLIMAGTTFYEVIARWVFNAPLHGQ